MRKKHTKEKLYEKATISQKNKKIISIVYLLIFIFIMCIVGYFVGIPIAEHIKNPEKFREWVQQFGPYGWVACVGLMVLQIIIAIIPGGAVEMGAGYAFGAIKGTIICTIGSVIGSVIVFMFTRIWGVKVVEAIFPLEKIRNLRFMHDAKRRNILSFIVFMIPGTPKDLLSYFMGLTEMELTTWILISTIARTPAIVVSTVGGDAVGDKNYLSAVLIIATLFIMGIIGAFIYKRICAESNKKHLT